MFNYIVTQQREVLVSAEDAQKAVESGGQIHPDRWHIADVHARRAFGDHDDLAPKPEGETDRLAARVVELSTALETILAEVKRDGSIYNLAVLDDARKVLDR